MSAHRTAETNDTVSKVANDNAGDIGNLSAHTLLANNDGYKAAQTPAEYHTAQAALGNLSITNDTACNAPAEAPKGFWARLGESFAAAAAAEAGMVPADTSASSATPEACAKTPEAKTPEAQSATRGPGVLLERSNGPDESAVMPAAKPAPDGAGKIDLPVAPAAAAPDGAGKTDVPVAPVAPAGPEQSGITAPPADAKHPQFQVNLGDLNVQPGHTNQNGDSTVRLGPGSTPDAPAARTAPEASGNHAPEGSATHAPDTTTHAPDVQSRPAAPAAQGGHDSTQAALKSAHDNVGKHVTELEPGINPRLGCVRMLSHALHEADPTFPETNNTAQFRRLLKQHGYEEVTVKPGDSAINHSNPGDIVIGSRPDGMPSHVAMSMGDGKVFNNNSDSGQGQLDSINQFNQGMHDSKGHWNSNGFTSVQMFRKTAKPEGVSN